LSFGTREVENLKKRDGLSDNFVHAVYEDAEHTLWIGTKGGLNRYRTQVHDVYQRAGLFSDEIYEIIEDDFGYFWMSCRKGIFRVRKQDMDDLDRGSSRASPAPCRQGGRTGQRAV